jgi:hypothetical protein
MWKLLVLIAIAGYAIWRWRRSLRAHRQHPASVQTLQHCPRCQRYVVDSCADPLCPQRP